MKEVVYDIFDVHYVLPYGVRSHYRIDIFWMMDLRIIQLCVDVWPVQTSA